MFDVDTVLPAWDNNRCAILAWLSLAQRDCFRAKISARRSQHEVTLSCRIAECPVKVVIRYDEVEGSEVVVESHLQHDHVIPCSRSLFSPGEEMDQQAEVEAKKLELKGKALEELNCYKVLGGKGRSRLETDEERARAQRDLKEDLMLALKSEEVEELWEQARTLGYIVGSEGARPTVLAANGCCLRGRSSSFSASRSPSSAPRPYTSSAGPLVPAGPSTPTISVQTPLPHHRRSFTSLETFASFLADWARSQGFSIRSAGGAGTHRVCGAHKTRNCGFFIKVKRPGADQGMVLISEACFNHSHRLKQPAAVRSVQDRQDSHTPLKVVIRAPGGTSTSTDHRQAMPRPTSPVLDPRQLRSPSLTPKRPVKRERSRSPIASTTTAPKRARQASSPLSDISSLNGSDEDEDDNNGFGHVVSPAPRAAPAVVPPVEIVTPVAHLQPLPSRQILPIAAAAQQVLPPLSNTAIAASIAPVAPVAPVAPPAPRPPIGAAPVIAERRPLLLIEAAPAPVAQKPIHTPIKLKAYLNALIPELPTFGDDFSEAFEAIGVRTPAYLLSKAEKGQLDRVVEVLKTGGGAVLPPLWREDLKDALLAEVGE